jgi:hypothetical protein
MAEQPPGPKPLRMNHVAIAVVSRSAWAYVRRGDEIDH